MTESLAYPVFLWAVLALHTAATAPSRRNDIVLLIAVAAAILARTQFAVLLVIIPLALLLDRFSVRLLLRQHRVLAVAYTALALVVVVLLTAGQLSRALGTYSVTAEGNLAPSGMPRSLLEHLGPIALGIGIVPFVLGGAWLVIALLRERTRAQHAFASIAIVTFVALLLEVTSYDLRFGAGRLHDRYLFYVVPLILVAFVAMLRESTWPRWAIAATGALVALAFAFMPVVSYQKFNVDSPVALLNEPLLDLAGSAHGAQLLLGLGTIVLTVLLASRRRVAVVLAAVAVLAGPTETVGAFGRLFRHDGTSGRPLTLDQSVVFDWIDRRLGHDAEVTMIPYPILFGTYWENVSYWWNVEFWNASIRHAAVYEDAFTGTPETFPTTSLGIDRRTGRMNASPSRFLVRGVAETRFHIAGRVLDQDRAPSWWRRSGRGGPIGSPSTSIATAGRSRRSPARSGSSPRRDSPRRRGGTSRSMRGRRTTSPPGPSSSVRTRANGAPTSMRTERAGSSRCACHHTVSPTSASTRLVTRRFTATLEPSSRSSATHAPAAC